VLAVDHFFPPSNPALPSAPDKKSFSSVSRLWVPLVLSWLHRRKRPTPLKELVFSSPDLVGGHVKLLGQFNLRLLASYGGKCLEASLWFRGGRLVMVSPVSGN
jgi:hypothetical protein